MPIDLGTNTTVTWARESTDEGNTVTLTVTEPDGDTATPAVTDTTGTFTATVTTGKPGRYLLTWEDETDTVTYTDTLEVWPADPRFIISAGDAHQALQWRPADITAHGERLRLYIASATEVIEDITGPIVPTSKTYLADGGGAILLTERPASIVSVQVSGTAVTGFAANLRSGIVYYDAYGSPFPRGIQNVEITYTVGNQVVPPNVQLAAGELVRHLWQVGQQISTESGSADYTKQPMGRTPSGFAVPNRVLELCRPHRTRMPGFG